MKDFDGYVDQNISGRVMRFCVELLALNPDRFGEHGSRMLIYL